MQKIAHYHLPGLFEFYDFYAAFLPVYRENRNWFYDWCDIASLYGVPGGPPLGRGSVGFRGPAAGRSLCPGSGIRYLAPADLQQLPPGLGASGDA